MNLQIQASALRTLALALIVMTGAGLAPMQAQAESGGCGDITRASGLARGKTVRTHTESASKHFRKRLEEFADAPLGCGEIVMLGDSLTEMNDWAASVPAGVVLRNRGISGDTSDGVIVRMGEVIASRPRAVFLLIGTNDLYTGNAPAVTVSNISAVVRQIRAESPGTLVFVQTVFPVRWEDASNDKVRAINRLLKQEGRRSHFVILDAYALLVGEDGKLNAAYTPDGLHLNEAGYAVWSVLVTATLRQFGLYGN